jgi:ubiquitin carboxyl-terminal hydrolase 9/24
MYVNPKSYCHSFKDWEGQPVNVIEQMDVEEYLNMFLDKLENSIKGTDRAGTINYHFGGQLANEMIGKTCPHRFTRLEPMLSVGVTVKNKKSVKEGMEAFIQGDMLEADN